MPDTGSETRSKRRRRPFWENVDRRGPEECWPWLGYVKPSNGHGLTQLDGIPIHASRKAWILTHGPIRGDLCVNHRCDFKLCCNPAHMYLGTRADNMIDHWTKRPAAERGPTGRRTVLTEAELKQLWEMRQQIDPPVTLKECAALFDVHIATICRYITAVRKTKLRHPV